MSRLQNLFKKIFQNRIVKHATVLVSGTVIAQLILIGVQLIIRRMYTPEDFGIFSLYMSIVSILVVIVTMRYELSVVLPEEDHTATSIVAGGWFISFCINLLLLFAIILFKNPIANMLSMPADYTHWLYFIPLSTFLFSVYQFLNYWLTRHSAYNAIAVNKICRRSSEGIFQIGAGLAHFPLGLPLGDIVGNSVNIVSGCYQGKRKGFSFKGITKSSIKSALKRYVEFPKYQAIPAVLNTSSTLLPVFFLTTFFGAATTGYFDLSRQILAVPIAFITASLMQVLLKELRDKISEKQQITGTILRTSAVLAAIMVPFIAIILLWGEELFGFVFSAKWEISGYYAKLLVFAFAVQFIVSPLSISFTVLEKLKVLAIWQIGYFLLVAGMAFFRTLPIQQFLILYTIINVVAYSVYFFLILLHCKKYDRSLA